jgi:adenine-specific DNA-methyltransferase
MLLFSCYTYKALLKKKREYMASAAKEMTMDERKAKVGELVRQFSENRNFYLTRDFVESEARSKFIDPLLECLKWDVHNEKGARHDHAHRIPYIRPVRGKVRRPVQ